MKSFWVHFSFWGHNNEYSVVEKVGPEKSEGGMFLETFQKCLAISNLTLIINETISGEYMKAAKKWTMMKAT